MLLPYEELIRTEEFWQETLETFSYHCAFQSKLEIKKEIKELVSKIMKIQKPIEKQNDINFKK